MRRARDNSSWCREGPWRQSLRRVRAHQARTSSAGPHTILIRSWSAPPGASGVSVHEEHDSASIDGDRQQSANDKLVRLFCFVGALKQAAARSVTAVVPYLCYSRKDRQTHRPPARRRPRQETVDVAHRGRPGPCRAVHRGSARRLLSGPPIVRHRGPAALRLRIPVVEVATQVVDEPLGTDAQVVRAHGRRGDVVRQPLGPIDELGVRSAASCPARWSCTLTSWSSRIQASARRRKAAR